jgi:solute carrier family 25 carnitine/acylcarnitine transporter 20/29
MFLSYEALMRGFSKLEGTQYQISTGSANFFSGGLGSFAFWGMAIPFDNIKNRMMAHPYPLPYPQSNTASPAITRRQSFLVVALHIYTCDGIRGFFRGLGPCFFTCVPCQRLRNIRV